MMPNRIELAPQEFRGLVDILEADASTPVQVNCSFGINLMFSSPVNELYLRSSWRVIRGIPCTTLDVARITLNNQGQGIGTKVLSWLKRYARSKGFVAIYIESIESERMVYLARKVGFSFDNDGGFGQVPGFYGNWSLIL